MIFNILYVLHILSVFCILKCFERLLYLVSSSSSSSDSDSNVPCPLPNWLRLRLGAVRLLAGGGSENTETFLGRPRNRFPGSSSLPSPALSLIGRLIFISDSDRCLGLPLLSLMSGISSSSRSFDCFKGFFRFGQIGVAAGDSDSLLIGFPFLSLDGVSGPGSMVMGSEIPKHL